ncbi:MAG: hypothetical protein RLZZ417_50 [Bacteroidota bacterium]
MNVKKIMKLVCFTFFFMVIFSLNTQGQNKIDYEVIVLGGGTGGTAAGIQAGRLGVKTLLVEPSPWLGGMLTAAGVSAIDGNNKMPAGIWGEFREKLRSHYGGAKALETGWVSNTHFEPHIGARILADMAKSVKSLEVKTSSTWSKIKKKDNLWEVLVSDGEKKYWVNGKILIDGTDLGDVYGQLNVPFDMGMEARDKTGEKMGLLNDLPILQDLTYVAILTDYGKDADMTLPKPKNYDPKEFHCSCRDFCPEKPNLVTCEQLLSYAKLPNNKYLINWPIEGNDIYLNVLEMNAKEREKAYIAAKEVTLRFIYYMQTELGFKQLGFAKDEYPTADFFPFLPYHREGRRLKGLVRMDVNHILEPYRKQFPLYRTGIAVGDYPIDHHHDKYPNAPEIDFPKVPSFSIPFGALIPKEIPGLIVADKPISVSNIVNGSTRLQPAVLQIGQAAGVIGALAVLRKKQPAEVNIREVQQTLLDWKGYLMPYVDITPDDLNFQEINRIGATGLIRGVGEPYLWANRTWFYPDTVYTGHEFKTGISDLDLPPVSLGDGAITQGKLCEILSKTSHKDISIVETAFRSVCIQLSIKYDINAPVSRRTAAIAMDRIWNPFALYAIDKDGFILRKM